MKRDDVYPSKWIKADDVTDEPQCVIKSVEMAELQTQDGKKEDKPVAYFKGIDKGLILSKTNWDRLEKQFGPESDDWIGKTIVLYAEPEARSDSGYAARVKMPAPKPKTGGGLKPKPADEAAGESDTPFS